MIGIGIPVWRAEAFVAETLDSVLAQRGVTLRVVISVDGADTGSARACRPFLSDARVRMVVQPARLGWVANTAAALAGAATEGAALACIQPHDDLIDPDYLACLVDAARAHPRAAVVFSDIATFGTLDHVFAQPSVTGTPLERQLALLREHYNAVAFRGLTRVAALAQVPPLAGNRYGDFSCDTVWMARLARAGDLVRVPRMLYRKRMHPDNAHARWLAWSAPQKIEAWLNHCLDMLAEAVTVTDDDRAQRARLVAAARSRLLLDEFPIGPYQMEIAALGGAQRAALRARFDDAVAHGRSS